MPTDAPGPSTGLQTGQNRTRQQMLLELAEYVGTADDPVLLGRLGHRLDDAIRQYNDRPWKFTRALIDIDLTVSPDGGTTYDVGTNFRNSQRAMLLDSSNREVWRVEWFPWRAFTLLFENKTSTGSMPQLYTALNSHQTGQIIVYPKLNTAALSYPKLRLYHHQWIQFSGDAERLNVPVQAERAIFQLALAQAIHTEQGSAAAVVDYQLATKARADIEWRLGDFPDYQPGAGE